MTERRRYCIQKLLLYDVKQKLENWKTTKYCNDDLNALQQFISEDGFMRVWDTVDSKVVKINKL